MTPDQRSDLMVQADKLGADEATLTELQSLLDNDDGDAVHDLLDRLADLGPPWKWHE